jgi:cytochrome b561
MAKIGHWALYGLMLAIPLTGWAMVSSSVYGLPTIVFGWFEWPHLPGLAANVLVHEVAEEAHWYLALALLFLLTAHIGAVVKHARVNKHNLLTRMWWGRN